MTAKFQDAKAMAGVVSDCRKISSASSEVQKNLSSSWSNAHNNNRNTVLLAKYIFQER